MFCTLSQDAKGKFTDGDGRIVTDALAKIPNKIAAILVDTPGKEFAHPENFTAHLRHVMRHGGVLLVQRKRGKFMAELLGVGFKGMFMLPLLPHEMEEYWDVMGNGAVVYGDFETYL